MRSSGIPLGGIERLRRLGGEMGSSGEPSGHRLADAVVGGATGVGGRPLSASGACRARGSSRSRRHRGRAGSCAECRPSAAGDSWTVRIAVQREVLARLPRSKWRLGPFDLEGAVRSANDAGHLHRDRPVADIGERVRRPRIFAEEDARRARSRNHRPTASSRASAPGRARPTRIFVMNRARCQAICGSVGR